MSRAPAIEKKNLWFRPRAVKIHPAMLDDFSIQKLNGNEFKKFFSAAVRGLVEYEYIRPCNNRELPWDWREIRLSVFARDGHKCTYCGDRSGPFGCDHVFPMALGGDSSLSNLTTACRPCNRSKKDKTLAEWREK